MLINRLLYEIFEVWTTRKSTVLALICCENDFKHRCWADSEGRIVLLTAKMKENYHKTHFYIDQESLKL